MMLDPMDDDPVPAPSAGQRRLRTAQEVRDRRRRRVIGGLSVAFFVLLVNSIVGENGYLTTVRQQSERAALEGAVARLRIENQRLQEEGRRLRQDPAALEEAARQSLGLIRPGETLIIYTPSRQADQPSSSSR
jgi:cell division protein FtsB